jgi:hypothetical protein
MPNPRYRVVLPLALGQQVDDIAEASGQARSAVIRRCVEMVIGQPELLLLLHQQGQAPLVDSRTEAQRQAWADYQKRYQQQPFDLGTILSEQSRV